MPTASTYISSDIPKSFVSDSCVNVARRMTPSGSESWLTGVVEAETEDGKWVAKALNTKFVPELILGRAEIAMRADGRFGAEDPLVWPQLISLERLHLVFIPQRPQEPHPAAVLWQVPDDENFIPTNDDPQGGEYGRIASEVMMRLSRLVGTLCSQAASRLEEVYRTQEILARERDETQDAIHRTRLGTELQGWQRMASEVVTLQSKVTIALDVFQVPSTRRECAAQWGHLHRGYTELWAWLEWEKRSTWAAQRGPVDPCPLHTGLEGHGVMGGVTVDKHLAATLYAIGAPVWLLVRRVTLADKDRLSTRVPFSPVPAVPSVVITSVKATALVGRDHIAAIWDKSHAVLDVEHVPLPEGHTLPEDKHDGPARRPQARQPSRQGGKAGEPCAR